MAGVCVGSGAPARLLWVGMGVTAVCGRAVGGSSCLYVCVSEGKVRKEGLSINVLRESGGMSVCLYV